MTEATEVQLTEAEKVLLGFDDENEIKNPDAGVGEYAVKAKGMSVKVTGTEDQYVEMWALRGDGVPISSMIRKRDVVASLRKGLKPRKPETGWAPEGEVLCPHSKCRMPIIYPLPDDGIHIRKDAELRMEQHIRFKHQSMWLAKDASRKEEERSLNADLNRRLVETLQKLADNSNADVVGELKKLREEVRVAKTVQEA